MESVYSYVAIRVLNLDVCTSNIYLLTERSFCGMITVIKEKEVCSMSQTVNIIKVRDGYHCPFYFFEDGRHILGNTNFKNFVCEPHSELFILKIINIDDLDCDCDESALDSEMRFIDEYIDYIRSERVIHFPKLLSIYNKYYRED